MITVWCIIVPVIFSDNIYLQKAYNIAYIYLFIYFLNNSGKNRYHID